MLRYGSIQTVSTTTTTTEDSEDPLSERRIRRLRLTLPAGNNGNKETKTADTAEGEKDVSERWKKRNGLIRRERPAGRESPQQHLRDPTNGVPETSLRHHGPKVYGVVQRMGSDRQQELMAREWTASHLHDEMRYIREVRDSLEKVRERMYGQFGGLQQSMEKLSREIREANSHRMSLESEVKTRTAAMESFDQMNSSLISANLSLQKSLLENCQNRVDARDEVKSLRSTFEKTQEKLRDKERELAAAQAENQTLKLQVESTREANTWAMQALAEKLHMEHEEELLKQQQKHREEIENLQAQLDEYIRRLEEAERNIRIAEAKIAERDQRIVEVERLLDCMGKEKLQLQKKLQESEQRLSLLKLTDTTDAAAAKRSKELKRETEDLKERIKHLNDMVFCQQRKVKGMIEEVESLRAQVAQKDMFISELLDRIAIVECENNELEDKVKYFMSTQNRPRVLETREVGVGCDLLPSREAQSHDAEPVHLDSTHLPSPFEPPLSPPQPSSPISSSSPTQWSSSNDTSSLTPPPPPSFPTHHPSFNQTPPVQPPLSPPQPSSPISSSSPTQWSSSNDTSSPTSPRLSSHPSPYPSFSLTQPRTLRPTNPPPSRLESSLLKYTPVQYSRLLQSSSSAQNGLSSYSHLSEDQPVRSGTDEVDAGRQSTQRESTSLSSFSSQPKSGRRQVYTPFMKLMEMTAKINIE